MNRSSRLLGARDLGIAIHWRFRFVPEGTRADTTPGATYLDVGSNLTAGVIDHHCAEVSATATSAATLLLDHRELAYTHLLGPLVAQQGIVKPSSCIFTIILHHNPDFDALVAAFLLIQLIEQGDFPEYGPALAAYTTTVDQGKYRLAQDAQHRPELLHAIHLGWLAMQHLHRTGEPWEEWLHKGFSLIQRAVSVPPANGRWTEGCFNPGDNQFCTGTWVDDPSFSGAVALLRQDSALYALDRQESDEIVVTLPVPREGRAGSEAVKGLVLRRPPRSKFNKYWVRAEGIPLFVCPLGEVADADGRPKRYPRVIISLDPTQTKATLWGLGATLEQRETEARRVARLDRRGPPRWPGADCADPWYDGRNHGFTIIDSPHAGTILPYGQIVAIVTEATFWHVPANAAAIVLAWVADCEMHSLGGTTAMKRSLPELERTSLTAAMAKFRAECSAQPVSFQPAYDLPKNVELGVQRRTFPFDLAPPLDWVQIDIRDGGVLTLESLAAIRQRIEAHVTNASGTGPSDHSADYMYAAVVPAPLYGTPEDAVEHALRQVTGSDLSPIEELSQKDSIVLFNSRALVTRSTCPIDCGQDEREAFFYLVFIREALSRFSDELSKLSAQAEGAGVVDAKALKALRKRFLDFQSRYYNQDISRSERVRRITEEISACMKLADRYASVQDQFRQVAELERRADEDARQLGAEILNAAVFLVGVAGVYQALIGFYTWPNFTLTAHWWWIVGVLVLALTIYALSHGVQQLGGRVMRWVRLMRGSSREKKRLKEAGRIQPAKES